MRSLIALLLLTMPAQAWEFSPNPVCTLSHDGATGSAVVTYDPRQDPAYAISLTRAVPWPDAPVFAIRFDGPAGQTISTNRQVLSDGGRTLTVNDRGFGNVLNGLEFNTSLTAFLGEAALPLSLDGAAPEVRKFRACAEGGIV